ncbi:uncharacterized protein Nmag_2623 [Natrialba magadii ATCC 43099]|uniref:Luciferase n=1 Tax=Natrialba magadii (strain ATCC 43099 / DSM 3394 / CCM 3739 / CIP 104546 / IAM 13178 / JCM 8861 / NBRC 102185 / NCIMB 2190 / MS3) TaxID=547559 RepID=D3SYZ0_NATMM|nr:hypothetical protein [Natrialba magadii]ADD06182.1 uncharacterized protein Nmag_2623 [Natrialba magadii ATCC 43099]ELY30819.1 hypothetical protein C500_07273 [Natrialba magadii ATCC 43099]
MLTTSTVSRAGLDAIALKPAECDVERATAIPADTIAIDYEGREHVPDRDTIEALAADARVLLTTPVRADGFDPIGDNSLATELPPAVDRILVAGHPAYLTDDERSRAVAPRLGAALESAPESWVGTESVERIAMATGATQYDLLSRSTERELRALRAAGFDGDIAVYAPTVLSDDEDVILDAVGDYVSRRRPVASALPESGDEQTDSRATGRAREVLLAAANDYALVGTETDVREQTDALREAGGTTVVGYPARDIEPFLE